MREVFSHSPESFSSPSPKLSTRLAPSLSTSKAFAFIESPFTVFPAQDSVGIEQFRVKKDWRNAVAFLKRKGHLV